MNRSALLVIALLALTGVLAAQPTPASSSGGEIGPAASGHDCGCGCGGKNC